MEITVGKVASWGFGLLFLLVGLGMAIETSVAGLIVILTGLFLIPKVRTAIDEKMGVSFSRWIVVTIGIVGFFTGAMLMGDVDTTTSGEPDEVAEAYSDNLLGFSTDTEAAYEMLSSDAQEQIDYLDYDEEIQNAESGLSQQAASLELMQTEVLEESDEEATVQIVYQLDVALGATTNIESEIDLVKEEEEWRIAEPWNPYQDGLDQQ